VCEGYRLDHAECAHQESSRGGKPKGVHDTDSTTGMFKGMGIQSGLAQDGPTRDAAGKRRMRAILYQPRFQINRHAGARTERCLYRTYQGP
jgi:hypothetical protein